MFDNMKKLQEFTLAWMANLCANHDLAHKLGKIIPRFALYPVWPRNWGAYIWKDRFSGQNGQGRPNHGGWYLHLMCASAIVAVLLEEVGKWGSQEGNCFKARSMTNKDCESRMLRELSF